MQIDDLGASKASMSWSKAPSAIPNAGQANVVGEDSAEVQRLSMTPAARPFDMGNWPNMVGGDSAEKQTLSTTGVSIFGEKK